MNFKLHLNEAMLGANANKLWPSQLSNGFYGKKPRLHTDCYTNEPLKGISQGDYSSVSFLPYAELFQRREGMCL